MKLVLDESESVALRRLLDDELQLVSSLIVRVELLRSVNRSAYANRGSSKALTALERVQLVRPSRAILERAEQLAPRSLRTLDAIHLATALEFTPRPDLFLCYDRRLSGAASAHGLAVVAPGLDEVHEP